MKFRFHMALIALAVALTGCLSPDTQPVIDAALQVKQLEDEELARHRQLASVAIFSDNAIEQQEAQAKYNAALDAHEEASNELLRGIIDWAQRVGEFDEDYANRTLDQMLSLYQQVREVSR